MVEVGDKLQDKSTVVKVERIPPGEKVEVAVSEKIIDKVPAEIAQKALEGSGFQPVATLRAKSSDKEGS